MHGEKEARNLASRFYIAHHKKCTETVPEQYQGVTNILNKFYINPNHPFNLGSKEKVKIVYESQTYHNFPFVRSSSSPTLCREHPQVLADAPLDDHWFLDGGLDESKADAIFFERELQRRNCLGK